MGKKLSRKNTKALLNTEKVLDKSHTKSINNYDINVSQLTMRERIKFTCAMYIDRWLYWRTKGECIQRNNNLSRSSFQITTDKIFTYSKVFCLYHLSYLPAVIPNNYFTIIKRDFHESFPDCTLIKVDKIKKYHIDFETKEMKRRLIGWSNTLNQATNEAKALEYNISKKLTENIGKTRKRNGVLRMLNSFKKIRIFQRRNHPSFRIYSYFYVYAPNTERLKECQDFLQGAVNTDDDFDSVELVLIKNYLIDHLNNMAITSLNDDKQFYKKTTPIILTDVDYAELTPFEEGLIGSWGTYVGTDIESHYPVFMSFTSTEDGQNNLIVGRTGKGKSFLLKGILFSHYLLGHRFALMDWEGFEYTPFVKLMDGVTISQRVEDAVCVNTLAIEDSKELSNEEAIKKFEEAISLTGTIFKILYSGDIRESDDVDALISESLVLTYRRFEVFKDNRSSYRNSHKITYFDVYEQLENMGQSEFYKEKYGDVLVSAIRRLFTYWHPDGKQSYLFKRYVNFDNILNARIVHFAFGNGGDVSSSAPSKESLLKVFNMSYIMNKYNMYNKNHGYYTVNLIEEFQRTVNSPSLLQLFNNLLSGARKLNVTSYTLTNSVQALLNNNDTNVQAMKENITSIFIGYLKKQGREEVIQTFELEDYANDIHDLVTNPDKKHAFVFVGDNGDERVECTLRMSVPQKLRESPLFTTRRVEREAEGETA